MPDSSWLVQDGCVDVAGNWSLEMPFMGCELRYQATADPQVNHPILVQRKSPNNPYISGAPLRIKSTPLPGYFALPAVASLANAISCPQSLLSGPCVLQGTLQELAAHCDQDPACHSFAYTELYRDNIGPSLASFKGPLDPNQTVLHQGAVLYVKDLTTAGVGDFDASLDTGKPWLNVSNGLVGDLGAGAAGPVEPGNRPAAFAAALQIWQDLLACGLGKAPTSDATNVTQAPGADDPAGDSTDVGAIVGGVVGGVAGLAAVAVLTGAFVYRRHRMRRNRPALQLALVGASSHSSLSGPNKLATTPEPPPGLQPPRPPTTSLTAPTPLDFQLGEATEDSLHSPFAALATTMVQLPSRQTSQGSGPLLSPAASSAGVRTLSPGERSIQMSSVLSDCASGRGPSFGSVEHLTATQSSPETAAPNSTSSRLVQRGPKTAFGAAGPACGGLQQTIFSSAVLSSTASLAVDRDPLDRLPTPELDSLIEGLFVGARNETWEDLVIPTSKITFLTKPDGSYDELGRGASGVVYRVLLNGVHPLAAKAIELGASHEAQRAFVKEVALLRRLRHTNVVAFGGIAIEKSRGYLLMELMFGDLWTAIPLLNRRTGKRVMSWHNRGARVLAEVAAGLLYLHDRNIVHADFKSSNVLLGRDGTAKLSDVGLARSLTKTLATSAGTSGAFGTWAWSAPEMLLNKGCTDRSDVFSFGVCLWEVCTGERPQRGRMRPIAAPEEAPAEIHDLQLRCVDSEPSERPSMREVCDILQRLLREQQQAKRGQQAASRAPSGVLAGDAAAQQQVQLPPLSPPPQPPTVLAECGEAQPEAVMGTSDCKAYG
ncbi:hypothetical protein N2152v2_007693 [Parachlorella kessleri]